MEKMVTRKVEWIEISEDDFYNKGTNGIERASEYFGIGYTIQDYYADNANIRIDPYTDNDYFYINDDGEKILVIVWEYYYINFNPYMDDDEYIGALEQAMQYADKNACYNREDILIYGKAENGEYNLIARRRWWNVEYDPDVSEENNPICFDRLGYYSDWEICEY